MQKEISSLDEYDEFDDPDEEDELNEYYDEDQAELDYDERF